MRRHVLYLLIVILPLGSFLAGLWLTPRPRLLWMQDVSTLFDAMPACRGTASIIVAETVSFPHNLLLPPPQIPVSLLVHAHQW